MKYTNCGGMWSAVPLQRRGGAMGNGAMVPGWLMGQLNPIY